MASKRGYVPVSGGGHTHITVSVDYCKRAGGAQRCLHAVTVKDGMVSFMVAQSPVEWTTIDGGWKRDNRKKVAALNDIVIEHVKARYGPHWDAVVAFAAKHGLTIHPGVEHVPEPAAAAQAVAADDHVRCPVAAALAAAADDEEYTLAEDADPAVAKALAAWTHV